MTDAGWDRNGQSQTGFELIQLAPLIDNLDGLDGNGMHKQ